MPIRRAPRQARPPKAESQTRAAPKAVHQFSGGKGAKRGAQYIHCRWRAGKTGRTGQMRCRNRTNRNRGGHAQRRDTLACKENSGQAANNVWRGENKRARHEFP